MELSIIKKTPELIVVDPSAGCEIAKACTEAIALAVRHQLPVQFDFNGVQITATVTDEVQALVSKFHAELDARKVAYEASPEGKRRAEELQQQQALRDGKATQLLAELPAALATEPDTVLWIGRFAEVSDYIGLSYDKQAVAETLESAGYVRNDCVGNPSVKTDKTVFARWLVGQAIDNLRSGFGIHQVAIKFAADYAKL